MRIRKMIFAPLAAVLALAACSVEKTQDGELPKVDVDAEGGQLPKVDVDPAEVKVGTDTQTVVTPEVDVTPASEPGEKN